MKTEEKVSNVHLDEQAEKLFEKLKAFYLLRKEYPSGKGKKLTLLIKYELDQTVDLFDLDWREVFEEGIDSLRAYGAAEIVSAEIV